MSDDIDRLKNVLEDIRILNDGLTEGRDAMRDIMDAVTPIELETDPEGHAALRDLAGDIRRANIDTLALEREIHDVIVQLCNKARA